MKALFSMVIAIFLMITTYAYGENLSVNNTKVDFIAVNGGEDAPNAGVTCFKITSPVSSSCSSGYIGVANNNAELISALLAAKVSEATLRIYYEDDQPNQHCPGLTFTPCVVSSVGIH